MSTVSQNPTPTCPPIALEACPAPLPPVAPCAEEGPPRPSKSALLPEIARLALAGHSGREIGKRLGVPRRTVARWLQELRQEWAEELRSLNDSEIDETIFILEETSGPAEARDPDELAEAISRLPAEVYRKLRAMLWNDYNLDAPFRWLTYMARLRRNVAITPVDKMFPPKVQDALFSPRIPDGGIDLMAIAS